MAAALEILVVDDDAAMVSTLRDVLTASGYSVRVAASGFEAIDEVRGRAPDCILMDIRMPGLNGVDAFREIKRIAPQSFVIFMTAYSSSSLVDQAVLEGAVEVLPKPLDLERLLRLIADTGRRTPVLIVDDDPAFSRSLRDALAAHDYDVRLAAGFEEAIELYRSEPRRVVVLDMKLDGRTGLDALPLLRALNPEGVIILMTGFAELVGEMEQGLELSASACLTKPLEVAELVGTIDREVERRRRDR